MQGWGGSCRAGIGHAGWVAHAGVGGSSRGGVFSPKKFYKWGGVGHVGVYGVGHGGWGGSCGDGVGWVMVGWVM